MIRKNTREFKLLDNGKFEIKQVRDEQFEVDPIDEIIRIKTMRSDLEKIKINVLKLVEATKQRVHAHNENLAILEEANDKLALQLVRPEPLDIEKELEIFNLEKLDEVKKQIEAQNEQAEKAVKTA